MDEMNPTNNPNNQDGQNNHQPPSPMQPPPSNEPIVTPQPITPPPASEVAPPQPVVQPPITPPPPAQTMPPPPQPVQPPQTYQSPPPSGTPYSPVQSYDELMRLRMMNKKPISGLAIASLVLGILSILTSITIVFPIIFAILAIIFGVISLKTPNKGMAIAGIVTGGIGILSAILLIVLAVNLSGIDWDFGGNTSIPSTTPRYSTSPTSTPKPSQTINVPSSFEGGKVTRDEGIAAVVLGEMFNAINDRDVQKLRLYYGSAGSYSENDNSAIYDYFDFMHNKGEDYVFTSVEITSANSLEIKGIATYSFQTEGQITSETSMVAMDFVLRWYDNFYKFEESSTHDFGGGSGSLTYLTEIFAKEQEGLEKFGTKDINAWALQQSWRPQVGR